MNILPGDILKLLKIKGKTDDIQTRVYKISGSLQCTQIW